MLDAHTFLESKVRLVLKLSHGLKDLSSLNLLLHLSQYVVLVWFLVRIKRDLLATGGALDADGVELILVESGALALQKLDVPDPSNGLVIPNSKRDRRYLPMQI